MSKISTAEYEDDKINLHEKTGIACDRLRQELKKCIKQSDCVQKDRRLAKDCIRSSDGTVPDRCFSLLSTFSDCKRSMVKIFNLKKKKHYQIKV